MFLIYKKTFPDWTSLYYQKAIGKNFHNKDDLFAAANCHWRFNNNNAPLSNNCDISRLAH